MNEDWTTGRQLFQQKRYAEAIPFLERAIKVAPTATNGATNEDIRGPALNHLAMAQYVSERYEDAARTFREAITQTPGKARLHYNLGNTLFALGQLKGAQKEYETALELDPHYDEAHRALIVVMAEAQVAAAITPLPASLLDDDTFVPAVFAPAGEPANVSAVRSSILPHLTSAAADPTILSETSLSIVKNDEGRPATAAPLDTPSPSAKRPASDQTLEEIAEKLRAAQNAVRDTRLVLARCEATEHDLFQQLLSALAAYRAEQEVFIRDSARRQAQEVLSDAAARAARTARTALDD